MILHILWKAVSSNLFLSPTGSEWLQIHFVKGSLITSFLMTNSMWAILQIFWHVFSAYLKHKCSTSHYIHYLHIRKSACCHISSMYTFYAKVIVVDCKISFQLTSYDHDVVLLIFILFVFQVSNAGSSDINFHTNLNAHQCVGLMIHWMFYSIL